MLPPQPRRFPAILDIGLTDNFVISPLQLRMWMNMDWRDFPEEGAVRFYSGEIRVPSKRAFLWIHPNQYGWRDQLDPLRPAVRMEVTEGITIYGKGEQIGDDPRTTSLRSPRLPLIGLRALTGMKAQLRIDSGSQKVWLDLPNPPDMNE